MKYAKAAAALKEYNTEARMDLLLSIDLIKRKINKTNPRVPTTCVSKNPREVLCTIDGSKAKNNAASKPTALPPISLPKK